MKVAVLILVTFSVIGSVYSYHRHLDPEMLVRILKSDTTHKKLCGTSLLREMLAVCNNCFRSKPVRIGHKEKRDRFMEGTLQNKDRVTLTRHCCMRGRCSEAFLQQFCCNAEERKRYDDLRMGRIVLHAPVYSDRYDYEE